MLWMAWYYLFIMNNDNGNEFSLRNRSVYVSNIGKDYKFTNDDVINYTYNHPFLIKYWFYWTLLIFLIDNYYINECFFWPTFPSFYNYTMHHLVPLNVILLVIYFIDIIFKIMMTPILIEDQGISDRKRLRLKMQYYLLYEKNGLLMITYVIFVVSFLIRYEQAQIVHLVIVLRLLEMNRFLNVLFFKIYTYKFLKVMYTLTIIFYVLLYLSHILGCIFYIIDEKLIDLQYFGDPREYPSHYYQFYSGSFMPIYMLSEFDKYIYAYYFSSGLVSTIAYGDVVGKNWIEDAYTLVLLVFSTITVAFLLQEFMIILGDYKFEIFEVIHRFKSLKYLMLVKNIQPSLQIRIRNSLLYSQYYDKFQNSDEVFHKLSERLKNDLYYGGYSGFFEEVFEPLGIKSIKQICYFIEEVTIQPEAQIFYPDWKSSIQQDYGQNHRNDALDDHVKKPTIIIIIQGKVSQYVQWQEDSVQFKIRQKAIHFNVYEFLTQTKVRYGLRSKSIIRAISYSQQNFANLLDEMPLIKKRHRQQREMILSNSTQRNTFCDKCQLCDQNDHNVIKCPDIHLVIDNSIARAYHIDQIMKNRVNFRRSNKKRKEIMSRKVVGLTSLYNIVDLLFQANTLGEKEEIQQEQLPFLYLKSSIRSILQQVNYKEQQKNEEIDCVYDPEGINEKWSLS